MSAPVTGSVPVTVTGTAPPAALPEAPRALVSVLGTLGHLHPVVPLAAALRTAGYQVRLATTADLARHVRAAGFDHLPVGGDRGFGGLDGPDVEAGRQLLADLVPGWLADLRRHAAGWRPDLVVRQWVEGASAVLAAEIGVPSLVCGLGLRPQPEYVAGHPVAAEVTRHGCTAADLHGDAWISGYPPSFARPGVDPLPNEHHVRPLLYDHHPDHPVPDWLDVLPDEPLVYATAGTRYNRSPGLFERMVEAFGGEPYHAVVTTGPDRDPGSVRGDVPGNVRLVRYVPQSTLMPRCAAVICHGGFDTVMSALSHGVPIGFVPLGPDHGSNATRCVDLGAGTCYPRMLSAPFTHVPPDRLEPHSLRYLVRRLLDGSAARTRADRIRAEIAALPGIDHAVAVADRLVGRAARSEPANDVR